MTIRIPAAYSLRAIGIICAALVLMTGVTFALFRSNLVMIEGSTISSGTAKLLLSTNGTSYSDTVPGFTFAGIEPGGVPLPQPGQDIYFKNDGTSPLNLGVSLSRSLYNPQAVRLDRVHLLITPAVGGTATKLSLSSLYDIYSSGHVPLNIQLAPGQTGQYKIQIQMDDNAVTTTQSAVTLSQVDLFFAGTSING